jgi:hypothetical protein
MSWSTAEKSPGLSIDATDGNHDLPLGCGADFRLWQSASVTPISIVQLHGQVGKLVGQVLDYGLIKGRWCWRCHQFIAVSSQIVTLPLEPKTHHLVPGSPQIVGGNVTKSCG